MREPSGLVASPNCRCPSHWSISVLSETLHSQPALQQLLRRHCTVPIVVYIATLFKRTTLMALSLSHRR